MPQDSFERLTADSRSRAKRRRKRIKPALRLLVDKMRFTRRRSQNQGALLPTDLKSAEQRLRAAGQIRAQAQRRAKREGSLALIFT